MNKSRPDELAQNTENNFEPFEANRVKSKNSRELVGPSEFEPIVDIS